MWASCENLECWVFALIKILWCSFGVWIGQQFVPQQDTEAVSTGEVGGVTGYSGDSTRGTFVWNCSSLAYSTWEFLAQLEIWVFE